ncbi:MAG: DUF2125 domain-containing protein [Alphaproteobacteria bacterium]
MAVVNGAGLRRIPWPSGWRRRAVLIGVAGVFALAAAYTILWFVAAGSVEARFREAVAARQSDDVSIAYGEITRAGFPGALVLDIAQPVYTHRWTREDGMVATLTWHDDRMTVRASPFRPSVLAFDWPKLAEITAEAADGRTQPPIAYHAERAYSEVLLQDGRALPLVAELAGVTATVSGAEAPVGALESFRLDGSYGDGASEPSARWAFEARKLHSDAFIPLESAALNSIDELHGVIDVYGPLPDTSSNAAMAAWREAGGRVVLDDGKLDAPALKLAWQGGLKLDGEMRPVMALATTVQGLVELMKESDDGLGTSGKAAESLTVVLLGLLSGQSDPKGPMRFDLESRDGRLYVGSELGSIRVGTVGPIDFEAPDGPLIPFSFRFRD